jgi:hypothetical protein
VKLSDGYLVEPALYIAPATAETGGMPHFPDAIKGIFNSSHLPTELQACDCNTGDVVYGEGGVVAPDAGGATIVPLDVPPMGTTLQCFDTAEYVWNVQSLGLTAGTYEAELVVPDGDGEHEVVCIAVNIR